MKKIKTLTITLIASLMVNGCLIYGFVTKPKTPIVPGTIINTIDLPEEFWGVLSETGQINSPMQIEMKHDTLAIGFGRD